MEISEAVAADVQSKLNITHEMIRNLERNSPRKASELRSHLYAIQVLLNELEEAYLDMRLTD